MGAPLMLHHGFLALDLAREREREIEEASRRRRLLFDADAEWARTAASRRRRARALVAKPVRAFSDATHSISHAACTAAARIEGRTA